MEFFINAAQAQVADDYCRQMMYGYSGWGMGGLLMVIFWTALIIIVILLLKQFWRAPMEGRKELMKKDNSLSILRERFAKDEITKEEYEEKKKILES